MPNSFAQTAELTCPQCHRTFDADVWRIVDAQERPDLLKRDHERTLHELPCLHCGHLGRVNAPLLVFRPTQTPPLIFRPADGATAQQNQQEVDALLAILRQQVGDAWQERWVEESDSLQWDSAEEKTRAKRQATGSTPVSTELEAILHELSQPARRTDMPRRVQLCEQALARLDRPAAPLLWAWLQGTLGNSLVQNSLHDRAENLERAIAAYEQALEVMTRQTMPVAWATITMNLAAAYTQRIRDERSENLERAIQLCEQALQVRTRQAMPVEWAETTHNLANAYKNRVRGERAENLEHAIQLCEQALQVRTRQAMPVEWAETTHNLANAYKNRIRGEHADNLERAIQLCEQALQVRTRQVMPVEWAQTTSNLANAYYDRIRGEYAENLERAIELNKQALQMMTRQAMPVEWAQTTMNLALAYANRIRGERAENLEYAVELYEQALQVRTRHAMSVEWAQTTNNLALVYVDRIRGERAENLERAIELYEQALQVRTRQAMLVEWAQTTMNLANAYANRIRGERAENLERAIELNRQALQVRTRQAMPVEWAQTIMNLALAYTNRIRGEREENLERAIELCEQALQVTTRQAMPVEWAATSNNLSNAYYTRIRGERAENLERAIELYEQALQVRTPQAMPVEWAQTTSNLANAYYDRIRGEREENLERAIELCEQALQVWTRQAMSVEWAQTTNNLALAYTNRIHGKREQNLKHAVELYEQALQVMTQVAFPNDHRRMQQSLGALHFSQARWLSAAEAFQQALVAGELLYTVAVTPEARQVELGEVRSIPAQCAYALAKVSDATPSAWRNAVLVLEQNRGRWLNESLALSAEKPVDVPDAIWQNFVAERTQIQQLQTESQLPDNTPAKRDYLTLSTALAEARKRLTETIAHMRQFDENFMPEPTFAQVQAAAQQTPLVYLLTTSAGGLALIVHKEGITPVWLALTETALRDLLDEWFGGYVTFLQGSQPDALQQWLDTIDRVTRCLWDEVMGTLVVALYAVASLEAPVEQRPADEAKPITLIPTGSLSVFPLHAAWTDSLASAEEDGRGEGVRRYFLDEFVVNYAPSARTLTHARQTANDIMSTHLLAVDEPRPVRGNALPNSTAEVATIADLFVQPQLFQHEQATRAAILAALPQAQVAHFSCHGGMNWENALESALFTANDEPLTVRDLLELRLTGARLATLSACETGIVGANLPDEVVALPGALLQAGFAGVVASLWSVADISTAMLMARFYDCWQKEDIPPAQALRAAQRWVRDTTNREKRTYFRNKRPDFFRVLENRPPNACDFAHPFWWAAFYLTGV